MSHRYFTRDCVACPFWDAGRCTMFNECSTAQDLFSAGEFYGVFELTRFISVADELPSWLENGYFVDIDGMFVDKMVGDGFDIVMQMQNNREIVGVLVPKSDK